MLLIYVRKPGGDTVPVELELDATVEHLISAAGLQQHAIIAYQGQRLERGAQLADVGVSMQSTVDVLAVQEFEWEPAFTSSGVKPKYYKIEDNYSVTKYDSKNLTYAMVAKPWKSEPFSFRIRCDHQPFVFDDKDPTEHKDQRQHDGVGLYQQGQNTYLCSNGFRIRPCDGTIFSCNAKKGNMKPVKEGDIVEFEVFEMGPQKSMVRVHHADEVQEFEFPMKPPYAPCIQAEALGWKWTLC
eukprot:Hpha_TRINITY_DN4543_c0_g1::TRINITY_DN4543_c0_g1_i1::g.115550::m.115550